MRITVFTPTYNRGYIIDNLFLSLKRQTFTDFEWVVVDDGSTDDTSELFQRFQNENPFFPIRYYKVQNGGKHRAINRGVNIAEGELFFIVDSDDYLTDNALMVIDRIEKTIPEQQKSSFAGVCGLRGFSENEQNGTTFSGDVLDITMLQRTANNINGDKAEVFYTSVLKKYPFPEFEGEKFITECVVWDKIANDGLKLRFFNKIIYIGEYLEDGLSAHSTQLFQSNPKGYGLYLFQSAEYGKIKGINKWNAFLKYYYQNRNDMSFSEIAKNLNSNPIALYFRLLGLRFFYKLYDN